MNHLKTHQTSLMAPWDPLNAPLDPLGPPGRGQREFSIPGILDESQLDFFSLDHEK